MLATLVIGLREGLEASLIVGIIAAFLRKNGKTLTAMWLGVALAVALSIAVGIALNVVEQALPQAAQEGMETVIGGIAIFFVTGMIAWMSAHARDMKRQLEAEAAQALSQASTYALASMAFLAVLKEGFETSVFLLATFSAAQSAVLAAAGAVVGLALAVVIGWGIYVGGVRINLSRFFRFTGAFLILVAAGLVISALRTAHEAGWLNAGQQSTMNLSWLVSPGTLQSALITGVLGIPADPRLIELVGWLAYLVPVSLFIYWPPSRRPGPRMAARLQLAIAAMLAVLALGLAGLYPGTHAQRLASAPLVASTGGSQQPVGAARLGTMSDGGPAALTVSLSGSGEITLALPPDSAVPQQHDGIDASTWTLTSTSLSPGAPSPLTLDQIIALAGGRVPVGLSPARHPGPFSADWSVHHSTDVWTANGVLLDVVGRSTTVVTLSGGGLQTPRTFTMSDNGAGAPVSGWQASDAYRDQAVAELNLVATVRTEHRFWGMQLPIALVIAAILLAALACRGLMRLRSVAAAAIATPIPTTGLYAEQPAQGARHAAH